MIGEMAALFRSRSGFFLELTLEHLQISAVSILLAASIGLVIGTAISEWPRASRPVTAAVNFLYTIPSISMLGFLIPLSGIGDRTAVIALTVYALLPMVRNTHTGLTGADPLLIEAAAGMGCTRIQLLLKVKMPLALPVIFAGLRDMAVMTIALAGVASFIGAGGLGVAIYRGITTNNKAMALCGSLLTALLAVSADLLIGVLERRTRRYGG